MIARRAQIVRDRIAERLQFAVKRRHLYETPVQFAFGRAQRLLALHHHLFQIARLVAQFLDQILCFGDQRIVFEDGARLLRESVYDVQVFFDKKRA